MCTIAYERCPLKGEAGVGGGAKKKQCRNSGIPAPGEHFNVR